MLTKKLPDQIIYAIDAAFSMAQATWEHVELRADIMESHERGILRAFTTAALQMDSEAGKTTPDLDDMQQAAALFYATAMSLNQILKSWYPDLKGENPLEAAALQVWASVDSWYKEGA